MISMHFCVWLVLWMQTACCYCVCGLPLANTQEGTTLCIPCRAGSAILTAIHRPPARMHTWVLFRHRCGSCEICISGRADVDSAPSTPCELCSFGKYCF